MIFLKLIVTNLLRHRIRTGISIAGIAFSVAAMLTIVTVLQGAVAMFSGLLSNDSELIVFERNVSDLFFSSVPSSAAATISSWPLVQHADPVLFGIVSSLDHPIITCFGVVNADARIARATWISGDRSQFAQHDDDVVLGERAAEFLKARTGDNVPIGHGIFHVIGVVRTSNGFEDGGVFMPLQSAQTFFHKEGTSSVVTVKLKDKAHAQEFARDIKRQFPSLVALEDQEFTRSYSQFRILKATAWTVGGLGLILGGLGVANTMIMSVFTRIREIAILRVNGFSNGQIATVVLGESAIVSLGGALLGLSVGCLLLFILTQVPSLHGYVDASIRPEIVSIVMGLALLTGVLGALYPAIYAMRVRAVEALRFE
jgi:putative ABC transport system permease protein